ncbi:MAG: DUF3343 domain-containing protein [Chitinivibrionales bacterium]|nr:DUF3343 domain-containing protein [Chitinivibrionales bacterium]MBD3394714.1 DUF3343 domain-containing protein [Chitinivibrionales bacterium]
MRPDNSVVLVHSTSHAIKAEKLMRRAGIDCKLIPVPRKLSSDCGICIRFAARDKSRAALVLAKGGIETEGIHDLAR